MDRGGDFFAEHDGLGRRIDRDFEFRLFVFFDAERAAAAVDDVELVLAERGVVGQLELAGDAAVVVGRERFAVDFFAFRIVNFDREGLVGERGFVFAVVLGLANPELELHRLPGR